MNRPKMVNLIKTKVIRLFLFLKFEELKKQCSTEYLSPVLVSVKFLGPDHDMKQNIGPIRFYDSCLETVSSELFSLVNQFPDLSLDVTQRRFVNDIHTMQASIGKPGYVSIVRPDIAVKPERGDRFIKEFVSKLPPFGDYQYVLMHNESVDEDATPLLSDAILGCETLGWEVLMPEDNIEPKCLFPDPDLDVTHG